MTEQSNELVFGYNADNDVLNSVIGYVHKVFSPNTYPCELCSLTHSNIGERKQWKDFRVTQEIKMTFIYKTEFQQRFKKEVELPAVIWLKDGKELILLEKKEITSFINLDQLMEAIILRLQTIV